MAVHRVFNYYNCNILEGPPAGVLPQPTGPAADTIASWPASGTHCHALPKRDVLCDVFSSLFRGSIIPGCILVDLVAHDNVVVARLSFPRATAMRGPLLELLPV